MENYAINKNANTDKNNNIPTIIPENHPYRYMLFDYIPKEDIKKWNDKHEENQNNNKNFVEFLFTEYSKNRKTRLVEFIVVLNEFAKQALVSLLLEETHNKKLANSETIKTRAGERSSPGAERR